MDLSNYILISRNNIIYKAKLETLSSIILLNSNKESFFKYLDDLSVSLNLLTSSFDTILYSKDEMKNDFTIKESVSNLTASGTYVLTGTAAATANKVKSKTDVDNWYNTQSMRSVRDVIEGYSHAVGILKDDTDPMLATEYGISPSYEEIMAAYSDADL